MQHGRGGRVDELHEVGGRGEGGDDLHEVSLMKGGITCNQAPSHLELHECITMSQQIDRINRSIG